MAEEQKYVRQVVVYADYFKEFKKTPPAEIERAKRIMDEKSTLRFCSSK